MNNDTSNRSTPATASPLTVKEAAPPVMIKKIGKDHLPRQNPFQ